MYREQGTGNKTLTLEGNNTGDNTFGGTISNRTTSGVISVTKDEPGKWILSGTNTYTGKTTVNAGTLALQGGQSIADTGTLDIKTGGQVYLYHGVKEKIDTLQFDGVTQAIGRWGSSSTPAENTSDVFFSGTGMLYVGIDLPPTGTVLTLR
jgi:fibronectin-binding autotransporter adhesin